MFPVSLPLAVLVVLVPLAAQVTSRPKAPKQQLRGPKSVQRQAWRWVTFLELPARRAEAADALLKMGKPAVPLLVRGLNNPRTEIVQQIAHILRALGAAGGDAKAKLQELAKGKDKRAFAAAWALAGIEPIGITVVADYNKHVVLELDRTGKVVHTIKGFKGPWDAERLPNGNYLVTEYSGNVVKEVTRAGKVVWQYKKNLASPYKAERLPNGNTLIANSGRNKIIEVSTLR